MQVQFTDDARGVDDRFYDAEDGSYDRLWDVLDRIMNDPEYARHAPWASYVSSRNLWGTKIPGTDYTVFWRAEGETLSVALIAADRGL